MRAITVITIVVLCCAIEWTSPWLTALSLVFCALYARAYWVAEQKYRRALARRSAWVYGDHGWQREA